MQKAFQSNNSPPSVVVESQSGKQTIPRQTTGGVTPLSFGLQQMWFLQQLDPTSPVYNTYRTWRVHGAFNVEASRKALETIGFELRGGWNEVWTDMQPLILRKHMETEASS